MEFTKTKAILAAIGAVVTVLTAAFADDIFNATDAGTIITVLIEQALLVFAVYQVPNKVVPQSTFEE